MIVTCDGRYFNVKDAESGKTVARFKSLERVLEFIEAVNYVKSIRRTVCC